MTQNKIIRFVLKLDPRLHVGLDEFKTLRWLPVSKRVHRIILNDVFEVKSGTPPEYMEKCSIPSISVHNYSTRFWYNRSFSLPKNGKDSGRSHLL